MKKSKKHITPRWADPLIAGVLLAIVVVPYLMGYRLTAERSMEPTLSAISLVRVAFGVQPVRDGQIVIAYPPGRSDRTIKRRGHVYPNGSLWLLADNKGVTGEDSDYYGPVSPDRVVGTVTGVITLTRILRSFTAKGRFRNWVEFSFGPFLSVMSEDGRFVAVKSENKVRVYGIGPKLFRTWEGAAFSGWSQKSQMNFWTDQSREVVRVYDPRADRVALPDEATRISLAEHPIRPKQLGAGATWLAKPKASDYEWHRTDTGAMELRLFGRWDNLKPYQPLYVEFKGRRFGVSIVNEADCDPVTQKQFMLLCIKGDVKDSQLDQPTILSDKDAKGPSKGGP